MNFEKFEFAFWQTPLLRRATQIKLASPHFVQSPVSVTVELDGTITHDQYMYTLPAEIQPSIAWAIYRNVRLTRISREVSCPVETGRCLAKLIAVENRSTARPPEYTA